MTKKISTRNYVCVLRDGSRFFLEEREAGQLKEAIREGAEFLEIGESIISIKEFSKLIGSDQYEEAEKKRSGMWRCEKCGRWHPRGEQCGCQGGRY